MLVKNATLTAQTAQTLLICLPVPYETPWKLFNAQYSCCNNLQDQNKANALNLTAAYYAQVASPLKNIRSCINTNFLAKWINNVL